MTLYVAASNDELELPVFVEENLVIFTEKLGANIRSVKTILSRSKKSTYNLCKGYRIYSFKVEKKELYI